MTRKPVDSQASLKPISQLVQATADEAQRGSGARACSADRDSAARVPPINNMGGKSPTDYCDGLKGSDGTERSEQTVMLQTDQGVKELTIRAGWGDDLAKVDAVSFTVHESTLHALARGRCLLSDEDFVEVMSARLYKIFGFGVVGKRDKGLNYYENSWFLGDKYGLVSFGGQKNTMLVQITGTGCGAACSGWEMRLYEFLTQECVRPRITRIDLCYDDLAGDYTVDLAHLDTLNGAYTRGGRPPYVEKRGDWDRPDGSGRTLYVGKRTNGKFARIYEKGKEQGDKNHPWVRVEVELKSVDRIIPFEALIDSGAYFAGCYPAFERFKGMKMPELIKTQTEEIKVTYDHLLHYAALQVGRLVNFMRDEIKATPERIVELLSRTDGSYPDRLRLSAIHCDFVPDEMYIHNASDNTGDFYGLTNAYRKPAAKLPKRSAYADASAAYAVAH